MVENLFEATESKAQDNSFVVYIQLNIVTSRRFPTTTPPSYAKFKVTSTLIK